MFQKLQTKWKVSGWRLLLILVTFATGGSLCGLAGRKLLELAGLEKGVLWVVTYIIVITLLWPICVLVISIPLGQFFFFKNYIRKLFRRMSGRKATFVENDKIKRIAIFASGAGSNAQKIIAHFEGHPSIKIALVVCNKPGAGVTSIAKDFNIPVLMIEKENFLRGDNYIAELKAHGINWIVLAGFLWKVPVPLITAYPNHIINIHPALLPKYGGKGMYGKHVHEAVKAANETETGITIHFVDELYDHGKIILQEKTVVTADDDADSIAQKVHELEYTYFSKAVEVVIISSDRE